MFSSTAQTLQQYSQAERTAALRLLADYEVKRTIYSSDEEQDSTNFANSPVNSLAQADDTRIDPSTARHPRVPNVIAPASWPRSFRRMPPYRPINYDLDAQERPTGDNPVISVFLVIVFCGCGLMSTYAWAWRNTLGRFDKTSFYYQIGGEY
ncbi:hypothetical protein BGW36DRAFT_388030 [Talaromyces proteolyticus]|uniref:Uncharacterized protein n=1 Tax=Talaromyces proteolyticus TaxID=1131652 RepID=A0AAD4PVF0_9EURO|nr:uncharacterized protein BGW36DRAFT_388030 [Talaromyces proteolyticus]KAH8691283.1 hypothetical protein BGW36DRAFT_388030 [Talaromyces proteolyticus]